LIKKIQGLWTLPSDRRLDLKFQRPWYSLFKSWNAASAYLDYLREYTSALEDVVGIFYVKDYDDAGESAMYHPQNPRTAQSTVDGGFSVSPVGFKDIAPWRRIV
jgi:hypothetical protein